MRVGYPVRIRDLGRVEVGAALERAPRALQRRTGGGARRHQAGDGQPLELSRRCAPNCRGDRRTAQGHAGTHRLRSSVFIDRSIDAVFKTIGEAILLVLAIIFFFLRNFRATLIPLVTIPVSLIGAFALMFMFGFSINTLTLLALVLAIGLGRRRDRRAREHLPPHRGRHAAPQAPSRARRRLVSRSSR